MARAGGLGLVTLTVMGWAGELPAPGHHLVTASGRTAYLVVEVLLPTREGTRHVARLRCERVAPADVPEGARVHAWEWGARRRASRDPGDDGRRPEGGRACSDS